MVRERWLYQIFVRHIHCASILVGQADVTFIDNPVRHQTEAEKQLNDVLSNVTQTPGSVLSSRWSEPSLTVHDIDVSGPRSKSCIPFLPECYSSCQDSTVIPGKVTAKVSLRIVPDQDLQTIAQSLVDHLRGTFEKSQSPNQLSVRDMMSMILQLIISRR